MTTSVELGHDRSVLRIERLLTHDQERVWRAVTDPDELRFELSDAGGSATRLVFTHAFAHAAGKEARDGAGWAACFDAFDALLAGAAEPAMGDWRAHERRFAGVLGDLVLEVDGAERRLHLTGPNQEVDGRPAVAVEHDGASGVLVVARDGAALADGAPVDLRAGSMAEPGEVVARGVLRDPLAAAAPATFTVGEHVEGSSS